MNLLTLTHADFIFINPEPRTPEALIRHMSDSLARRGVIHDKHAFIDSVLHRESEGPTALGEELAVPHGKSESVAQAAFCVALFEEPITWPGLEGDEKVRMVFLLAIPSREAGSTHMQLLTTLTTSLTDDETRSNLLAASTREEVLSILGGEEEAPVPPAMPAAPANNPLLPVILGIITAMALINAGLSWAGHL
ncbi:PTS sugar transporter subunit IIA [Enterobacter sp. RHBSTW-00901]|uniref:fructose PTS transporter subunit IIA n=1 Tax=Enterobacter sp. RHBSTW-00901 TaxID=2742669 RepID=UPI0015F6D23A|nr:fructose PTS transporter subunit IIA [Enterobacter sp. RHBSTW-00901]MBA7856557.1 PTS sugar transporter subunit IIA [Enterobacter sp. RHBSTW-00901]